MHAYQTVSMISYVVPSLYFLLVCQESTFSDVLQLMCFVAAVMG